MQTVKQHTGITFEDESAKISAHLFPFWYIKKKDTADDTCRKSN